MIINNKNNETKILLDIEDIKNAQISLENWLISPQKNIKKLFQNFPEFQNINAKNIYIYTYKFIIFYVYIK